HAGISSTNHKSNNKPSFIQSLLPFGAMTLAIWHLASGIRHLELIIVPPLKLVRDLQLQFGNSSALSDIRALLRACCAAHQSLKAGWFYLRDNFLAIVL